MIDGNVGIGTASPNKKLVVAGDLNASGSLYVGNGGSALSIYEESSFAPTFNGSVSGTGSHQYKEGRYTRIGNVVSFYLYVSLNDGAVALNGNVQVHGLPYNSLNTGFPQAVAVGYYDSFSLTANQTILARVAPNSKYIDLYYNNANTASVLPNTTIQSQSKIAIGGSYLTIHFRQLNI